MNENQSLKESILEIRDKTRDYPRRETLQQELKKGQDNYNKLWDMYSELKKENKKLRNALFADINHW